MGASCNKTLNCQCLMSLFAITGLYRELFQCVSGCDGGQVEWRHSPDGCGVVGQRVEDAGQGQVCG